MIVRKINSTWSGGRLLFHLQFLAGDVAQLEERHNGIVEVVGSIPIVSTSLFPEDEYTAKHIVGLHRPAAV